MEYLKIFAVLNLILLNVAHLMKIHCRLKNLKKSVKTKLNISLMISTLDALNTTWISNPKVSKHVNKCFQLGLIRLVIGLFPLDLVNHSFRACVKMLPSSRISKISAYH
jgi:hypothetical protein